MGAPVFITIKLQHFLIPFQPLLQKFPYPSFILPYFLQKKNISLIYGMKNLLIHTLLVAMPSLALSQNTHYMLVGTYTSGNSKGEGIYVYAFNSQTGEVKPVSKIKTSNPSFLAISPDEKYVYAVHENDNDKGSISAFSFNKADGTLKELNKQNSGGEHPCHVAIDKTGKFVVAGNYSGGSFAILPVKADGSLRPASQTFQQTGSSVDKKRQDKPHVHSSGFSPDNKFLLVADLGTDKLLTYSFQPSDGKATPAPTPFAATTPGTGPRHFDFHPNGKFVYLMEEMSGKVTTFDYKKGVLKAIQSISAIQPGYTGPIGSADIHVSPDGKFVYASNRGESNDIAIFSIDQKTGKLAVVGHQSTLGKGPRNFNLDPTGNFVVVANQNSDNIVIFKRDPKTGLLSDTGKQIEVGKPVCIKWID